MDGPMGELAPKWLEVPRSVRRKEGERIYGRSDLLSGADIAILPSGKSVINDDCERRIVRDPSEARSTGKSHPSQSWFGDTGVIAGPDQGWGWLARYATIARRSSNSARFDLSSASRSH